MGQHYEIRFNEILKYCVVEKFRVVLCTTARNCQCGPMLRKDKIFGLILILIISVFPTFIYRYRFLLDISGTTPEFCSSVDKIRTKILPEQHKKKREKESIIITIITNVPHGDDNNLYIYRI